MWFLNVLSSASEYLTNPGSCIVACVALILAAYVINHVIDNASYLKIKSNYFEGEFRPRDHDRPRPKVKVKV